MDIGIRRVAPDRRAPRPADTPRPYPVDERRELSPGAIRTPPETRRHRREPPVRRRGHRPRHWRNYPPLAAEQFSPPTRQGARSGPLACRRTLALLACFYSATLAWNLSAVDTFEPRIRFCGLPIREACDGLGGNLSYFGLSIRRAATTKMIAPTGAKINVGTSGSTGLCSIRRASERDPTNAPTRPQIRKTNNPLPFAVIAAIPPMYSPMAIIAIVI